LAERCRRRVLANRAVPLCSGDSGPRTTRIVAADARRGAAVLGADPPPALGQRSGPPSLDASAHPSWEYRRRRPQVGMMPFRKERNMRVPGLHCSSDPRPIRLSGGSDAAVQLVSRSHGRYQPIQELIVLTPPTSAVESFRHIHPGRRADGRDSARRGGLRPIRRAGRQGRGRDAGR